MLATSHVSCIHVSEALNVQGNGETVQMFIILKVISDFFCTVVLDCKHAGQSGGPVIRASISEW